MSMKSRVLNLSSTKFFAFLPSGVEISNAFIPLSLRILLVMMLKPRSISAFMVSPSMIFVINAL